MVTFSQAVCIRYRVHNLSHMIMHARTGSPITESLRQLCIAGRHKTL